MSSTVSPRHDASSRTWWTLSAKPTSSLTPNDASPQYKSSKSQSKPSGLNFNSFATAIGFKSKKHHPSLAIQEPPLPVRTVVTSPPSDAHHAYVAKYPNRPSSKSVSSTRSRVDSIEPRTPSDGHREARQSLLTLSDIDPFAGRGVVTVSVPQTPSDPNRLSAYSNLSATEFAPKKGEVPLFNRTSYGSSSSNSHIHATELSPLSPTIFPILPAESELPKKVRSKKTAVGLHGKRSFLKDAPSRESAISVPESSKSGSSSRSADRNRLSQPEPTAPLRPTMRPRGMTDNTATKPGLFSGDRGLSRTVSSKRPSSSHKATPPPVSPRVVVRQASMSRIGSPPSAPPAHGLPAPPHSPVADSSHHNSLAGAGMASASSSSLSFASSVSSGRDLAPPASYSPRQKEKRPSERSFFSLSTTDVDRSKGSIRVTTQKIPQSPPTSPPTLKKALSHSSLGKRATPSAPPPSVPNSPPERTGDKAPRKQKSFHHPRIPIPPIPLPLRHTSSFGASSSPPTPEANMSILEKRRGSATSTTSATGRKRLFSGSSLRRPSTSQGTPVDDDTQSIFSLRSNPDQLSTSHFKPWTSPQPSLSQPSFWDEGAVDTTPNSPVRSMQHEYTPQHIMTPDEMAKVEASMEMTSPTLRGHGLSVLSVSTVASQQEAPLGLTPPPSSWSSVRQSNGPSRTNSMISRPSGLPTRLLSRPSTAQPSLSPSSEQSSFRTSSSPTGMTSLPPPPRPRKRPTIITEPDRSSIVVTPLSLPPRNPSRPKPAVERSLHRHSLMRKPSFLDIDDETDKDTDLEDVDVIIGDGSFLDLARESFDTVRSSD
ncbi:hypothetical protein BDQ12DRAFT_686119 [Crucibulum laeve]|uniref:Uncharacterized protein n=1 Tax=Crucibulum laeve TaxID=68775 RepID=A0A5C3LXT2_9AGAR|nr:hypothetical protein BDQ12DRAFT_686119 [Crucibulum laeve]